VLQINSIEVVYANVIKVLRGVSLQVGSGKIVALLGTNGAGKTTTLKAVSGILKTEQGRITEGAIEFEGRRINGCDPEDVAKMGISQAMEGRKVLEHLTVEENLLVGAHCLKGRADVKGHMEMVFGYLPKLKNLRKRVSGYLSGGEQQMLAVGRALISGPRLMLLDEPSLGLSPLLVQEIYDVVEKINKEQKTSMLLVEQNATAALGIADYAYVMENGKIVLGRPAEQLRDNEDVREFYLGLSSSGGKKSYRDFKHYKRRKKWLA